MSSRIAPVVAHGLGMPSFLVGVIFRGNRDLTASYNLASYSFIMASPHGPRCPCLLRFLFPRLIYRADQRKSLLGRLNASLSTEICENHLFQGIRAYLKMSYSIG